MAQHIQEISIKAKKTDMESLIILVKEFIKENGKTENAAEKGLYNGLMVGFIKEIFKTTSDMAKGPLFTLMAKNTAENGKKEWKTG